VQEVRLPGFALGGAWPGQREVAMTMKRESRPADRPPEMPWYDHHEEDAYKAMLNQEKKAHEVDTSSAIRRRPGSPKGPQSMFEVSRFPFDD
jgi:hypothetical protein